MRYQVHLRHRIFPNGHSALCGIQIKWLRLRRFAGKRPPIEVRKQDPRVLVYSTLEMSKVTCKNCLRLMEQ